MSGDGSAATPRAWVILRSQTTVKVYRGFVAASYEEAERQFMAGEGELVDTRYGPWEIDGEVDYAHTEGVPSGAVLRGD